MQDGHSFLVDKYMTTIKVGPKGQLVIPKEARELYGIQPGDTILLLAGKATGISLLKPEYYQDLFTKMFPPQDSNS